MFEKCKSARDKGSSVLTAALNRSSPSRRPVAKAGELIVDLLEILRRDQNINIFREAAQAVMKQRHAADHEVGNQQLGQPSLNVGRRRLYE